MKISDYIIMSDVDGTLLPYGSELPRRNREAIERFVAKGGSFGIATGRSRQLTEEFANTLPVNAPCVLYNGGALYDFTARKFLMQEFLPESAKADIKTIIDDNPHIAVLVISDDSYHHVTHEIPFANFSETHKDILKVDYLEHIDLPWFKALFSVSLEDAAEFDAYLDSHAFEGIRFVRTNPTLVELLPAVSTKGLALSKLVDLGIFKREGIAAIGDFYNDIEMIEYAAIGAATAEAPDDIKAIAQFVTGPCINGAVADLVEYIESIADCSE